MIKEIIEPTNERNFKNPIFSIINNKVNSIDVDKLDYMSRDPYHIGIDTRYKTDRIINKSYIARDHTGFAPRIIYSKGLEKRKKLAALQDIKKNIQYWINMI